jgi:CheY-like chemotaxis protein
MTFHALAIDDDPAILDDVKDRLECLGHTCDCATCLNCARKLLTRNTYSYILLDLQIPVCYGRKSRIPNGQNLLREIRAMKGYADIPIIVMTTHGHDSPDLAVEVFRCDGASDFVKKPFADRGHTLEKAVRDALAASGRSRPGAAKRSGPGIDEPPRAFECGEMVFSPSRIDLCDVKVCGGPESGMIRRILDELRHTNSHGRFVRYDGKRAGHADRLRTRTKRRGRGGERFSRSRMRSAGRSGQCEGEPSTRRHPQRPPLRLSPVPENQGARGR